MYCPAHFQEDRPEVLTALMSQHPLATVITQGPAGMCADHIPLMFEPVAGTHGRLIGHVARNNPLWQCDPAQELLVVFQGPSAYISPNWYATKAEGGKVVPTWNYAVVHAHARLRALPAPEEVLDIITRLTDRHEAEQPHPWQVADAPADFTQRLLGNIVGIELSITRLQGKWKVSQNQPEANRLSVAAGLRQAAGEGAEPMAGWVSGLRGRCGL